MGKFLALIPVAAVLIICAAAQPPATAPAAPASPAPVTVVGVATAPSAPAYPPCQTEDAEPGTPPCYWDAATRGNHTGRSYIWDGSKIIYTGSEASK